MNQGELLKHWYADVYEQEETGTDDVECLLSILGVQPRRILEVACGGGRISVPLALAGHDVTGFDMDEEMLKRARHKGAQLQNFACYRADALTENWGEGFDAVVLAGNLLVNIETDGDYQNAQRLLIRKASECLLTGGHLYLDFDIPDWPDQSADERSEWVCFTGTDDRGTEGKYVVISGDYSRATRVDRSFRRYELTPSGGQTFIVERVVTKHFPTLAQVLDWCVKEGFLVEQLYGDHQKRPATDHSTRAVIWARKI